MSFISPMLAAPMPKSLFPFLPGQWVAEEKFDGHRLVVRRHDIGLSAWSRDGKSRSLPAHVTDQLNRLPVGVYDGELYVPGKRSYGVTELTNTDKLVFVMFDILELLGQTTTDLKWDDRRKLMVEIFERVEPNDAGLRLSAVWQIHDGSDIDRLKEQVWSRDGEGLILKRRASRYSVGKRPKGDWIKIKGCHHQLMKVVGFEASKGTIQNRGAYASVVLEDRDGHRTTVKTLNDAECRNFEREEQADLYEALTANHPAIGRFLWIEYQERTPHCPAHRSCGGGFRHPMWDRWAESGETW